MHDHATDGGRQTFESKATAREMRLHLDNAHNFMTSGWTDGRMVERHRKFHKDAEIEAAANLIAEGLASAPPAVVESIVDDRSLYLTDANGAVYLAEQVDPRHMPAAGPLYRLTAQVPPAERVLDLLEQTRSSLAATRTYLDAHPESEGAHLSGSPAGLTGSLAGPTSAGAPLGGESS